MYWMNEADQIKIHERNNRERLKNHRMEQDKWSKIHEKNVKVLRKACRNKIELDKCITFLKQYGKVTTDKWGLFDENISRVISNSYVEKHPEIECKRCGLCCTYVFDTRIPQSDGTIKNGWNYTGQPCRELIDNGDGTTTCPCYEDRIGKHLEWGMMCIPREISLVEHDGCPYNDIVKANVAEKVRLYKKYHKEPKLVSEKDE